MKEIIGKFIKSVLAFLMVFTMSQATYLTKVSADLTIGAPETVKTVKPNNDGTYEITLDILGKINSETKITGANVVVVLDTSGSMGFVASSSNRYPNYWEDSR